VLGYARSGTSTITRSLGALGVDLGDRLRAGKRAKNPRGFFEDTAIMAINRRLRRTLIRRQGVSLLDDDAFAHPRVRRLQTQAVEAIRSGFGPLPLWGIKNNGVLRFFPFWQAVFERIDANIDYVVAVRSPLNAVRSRRNHRASKSLQPSRPLEIDLYEWLVSVVPYFSRLEGSRFIVVDYDRLMDNPDRELHRMAETLRLPLPQSRPDAAAAFTEGFLARDLRHFSGTPAQPLADDGLPPLVAEAWHWLQRLATDDVRTDHGRLWPAWDRMRVQLQAAAPLLADIDRAQATGRWAVPNLRSLASWLWQRVELRSREQAS
jgi:hypothetical protein